MSMKFWGMIAAAAVGVAIVAKKVLDKQKEEDEEVELVEVGTQQEKPEIVELKENYPYLPINFLKDKLVAEKEYMKQFQKGDNLCVIHQVSYDSKESAENFKDILTCAGYEVLDDGELSYNIKHNFVYEAGSIASDIFNVANQVIALGGNYNETIVNKAV